MSRYHHHHHRALTMVNEGQLRVPCEDKGGREGDQPQMWAANTHLCSRSSHCHMKGFLDLNKAALKGDEMHN